MWHVAVPPDFVAGVNNDDSLVQRIADIPRRLAEECGFPYARPAKDEDARALLDEVFDDLDLAEQCPANPTREPNDLIVPVSDCRDTVECLFDTRTVVAVELPYL